MNETVFLALFCLSNQDARVHSTAVPWSPVHPPLSWCIFQLDLVLFFLVGAQFLIVCLPVVLFPLSQQRWVNLADAELHGLSACHELYCPETCHNFHHYEGSDGRVDGPLQRKDQCTHVGHQVYHEWELEEREQPEASQFRNLGERQKGNNSSIGSRVKSSHRGPSLKLHSVNETAAKSNDYTTVVVICKQLESFSPCS